jgi:hypothetical protein
LLTNEVQKKLFPYMIKFFFYKLLQLDLKSYMMI